MKVIKIGAEWCSGCLVMKPRWQKIEKQLPWLKTEYYDFDEDEKKIKKLGINVQKLPVFIFLHDNEKEIRRLNGEMSEKDLYKVINEIKSEEIHESS